MVRLVPGDSISLERAGCPQGMAQVQQVTETELCRLSAGFLNYLLTTNKFNIMLKDIWIRVKRPLNVFLSSHTFILFSVLLNHYDRRMWNFVFTKRNSKQDIVAMFSFIFLFDLGAWGLLSKWCISQTFNCFPPKVKVSPAPPLQMGLNNEMGNGKLVKTEPTLN